VTEPAERESSARSVIGLGRRTVSPAEAALDLRWLSPGSAALTALGRYPCCIPPGSARSGLELTWSTVRLDPGAVLLLVRAANPTPPVSGQPSSPFVESLLNDPAPLDQALLHLDGVLPGSVPGCPTARLVPDLLLASPLFVDWNQPDLAPLYRASVQRAALAHALAERLEGCDPERAWVCGLLAGLGWLAVAAAAPREAAACLADPGLPRDPNGAQIRHWGMDHGSLVRRLARRWGLPDWLVGVIGYLGLPAERVGRLGGDPVLLSVTRQAIRLGRESVLGLEWSVRALRGEDEALPGLAQPLDLLALPLPASPLTWERPSSVPLLVDLLRVAAEQRRQAHAERWQKLEREADELARGLEEQSRDEEDRLQSAKLTALAEFAAGAGHEINNPLAVISGQAQYLLGHQEWFPEQPGSGPRQTLEGIMAQTRRIHGILRDLMLFARPSVPRPVQVDVPTLLGEVAAGLAELAQQRRVRVEIGTPCDRLPVYVDLEQMRLALSCLLRNAIEAAGPGGCVPEGTAYAGWVRLVLVPPAPGSPVEVWIEDSGAGPAPAQRPLLFDPFFSGRSAGRGRGLGLPIAWRLARLQGGDVRLEPARVGEPTRFVLSLPGSGPPAERGPLLGSPRASPREQPRDAA
jgi:signal transduction histidine kinase